MIFETYIYCTDHTCFPITPWEEVYHEQSREVVRAERRRIQMLLEQKVITSPIDVVVWDEYLRSIESDDVASQKRGKRVPRGFLIPARVSDDVWQSEIVEGTPDTLFRAFGIPLLPIQTSSLRFVRGSVRKQSLCHVLSVVSLFPLPYQVLSVFIRDVYTTAIFANGPWGSILLTSTRAKPYQVFILPDRITVPEPIPAAIDETIASAQRFGRLVASDEYTKIIDASTHQVAFATTGH